MEYTEKAVSIDDLQSHTLEIISSLAGEDEPLVVTQDGEPKAVLQDYANYEETSKTIAFWMLLAHSCQQVKEGKVVPKEEAFRRIRESTLSPVYVEN